MYDDRQCVARVLQGDKEAYGYIIEKYMNRIYAILFRMLYNKQDAQDLTQECFIRAYQCLDKYNETGSFASWLYRISVNLCLDELRKRKHITLLNVDDYILKDTLTPEDQVIRTEEILHINQGIDRLPNKYKIILVLRYSSELSYEEISEVLHIPVSTTRIRLHRAKKKLRAILESNGIGGKVNEVHTY
ncbi:RNA polymerase sigma factor [Bacillus horti]|uniref:RNA polymerase sigma-70 factor (ECF subfamily) n=1 Tax=Caldalkalibacillus horti TaxID=77523 RepID=A0ABT9W1W1_9BACI|nr:sigma-70 family RNA polymerase sigma factor [Bacillus horti]MDQ0167057.1 RNA polymerase sigma-70 factor (ECF subfamily) [Bacillus horti]